MVTSKSPRRVILAALGRQGGPPGLRAPLRPQGLHAAPALRLPGFLPSGSRGEALSGACRVRERELPDDQVVIARSDHPAIPRSPHPPRRLGTLSRTARRLAGRG